MYKLLLIEDSHEDIEACVDSINVMNDKAKEQLYEVFTATSYEEALKELKNNYDATIIDINLDGEHSGNEIIKTIINQYRIPVAVMTATPDTDLEDGSPIQVYKKGEAKYDEIIENLHAASQTGLFKVLGRVGVIEQTLNKIFWEHLYPHIDLWQKRKENGVDTEIVLLRYALSHVQELIDIDGPSYITEEMYIKPPLNKDIRTGTIYQSVSDKMYSIVLSPPCDLAIYNGKLKNDTILLCEIEDHDLINKKKIKIISQDS